MNENDWELENAEEIDPLAEPNMTPFKESEPPAAFETWEKYISENSRLQDDNKTLDVEF